MVLKLAPELADYSADSNANHAKIGLWVWAFTEHISKLLFCLSELHIPGGGCIQSDGHRPQRTGRCLRLTRSGKYLIQSYHNIVYYIGVCITNWNWWISIGVSDPIKDACAVS